MSQWVFLSYLLNNKTPTYGNGDTFEEIPGNSIKKGDSSNTSTWRFPNHIGTHIDFPLHFADDGSSLNDFLPSFWIFNNIFIRVLPQDKYTSIIDSDMLAIQEIPDDTEIVLIKTGFCHRRNTKEYWSNGPVFEPEISDALRRNVPLLRVFGMDTISISSWADRKKGRETHRSFLAKDKPILILEDLDLTKVNYESKIIQLIISPLMVDKSNGTPCTVFAEVE